jgi:hypothetical protein
VEVDDRAVHPHIAKQFRGYNEDRELRPFSLAAPVE